MRKLFFLAGLVLLSAQKPAQATELSAAFNEARALTQVQDAFQGLPACAVVDAKFKRAPGLMEAEKMLIPCLKSVSDRYQSPVSVEAGIIGRPRDNPQEAVWGIVILIPVPAALPPGSSVFLDINHALSLRRRQLLGQKTALIRYGGGFPVPVSAAQKTLEDCPLPRVPRDIRSSQEFLDHYGQCFMLDKSLRVSRMLPADHRLAVTLVSGADEKTVAGLSGEISLDTTHGPVTLLILGVRGE